MSKLPTNNVKQIRRAEPGGIEPLEGWKLHSDFGFMACDDTSAGRLVRLADIVWWLMRSKSLPRLKAMDVLCEPMERGEVMDCLYQLTVSDYATRVPANWMFGYFTAEQQLEAYRRDECLYRPHSFFGSEDRTVRFVYRQRELPPAVDEAQPGAPALVQRLRSAWSAPRRRPEKPDPLDDPRFVLALAVPIHRAHAFWGYGRMPAAPEPVAVAVDFASLADRSKGVAWRAEEQAVLLAEFDRRMKIAGATKSFVFASIGKDLGLSRPSVEAQVDKARSATRSAMPTTFAMGSPAKKRRS